MRLAPVEASHDSPYHWSLTHFFYFSLYILLHIWIPDRASSTAHFAHCRKAHKSEAGGHTCGRTDTNIPYNQRAEEPIQQPARATIFAKASLQYFIQVSFYSIKAWRRVT